MNIERMALRALTAAFNEFVAACVDEHGKPRAPTAKALAKARGCLPNTASMGHGYKMRIECQEKACRTFSLPAIVIDEPGVSRTHDPTYGARCTGTAHGAAHCTREFGHAGPCG